MLLRAEKEKKERLEKETTDELSAFHKLFPMDPFAVFGLNVSLINLASACIEGALNHLVITELFGSDDPNTLLGKQKVFRDFVRDRVELDGGWTKAQNFFRMAFDKTVQDILGSPLNQALDHLNTIRNSTAHGSNIVFPDSPIPESASDVYPYSWQKRLSRCSVYLDHFLDTKGLNAHLRNPELAFHWWTVISNASSEFLTAYPKHEGTRLFEQIRDLEPGHRWSPPKKKG